MIANPQTVKGAAPFVDHNAVRAVVGKIPPTPVEQAQALVKSELSPIYAGITGAYNSRGAQGAAAIKALTDRYAAELGNERTDLSAAFQPAEAATAASSDALANRLTGQGTAGADALAARLASIQAPGATSQATAALSGRATGAGNAIYSRGNASLEQLLGNAANADAYAVKLPGIARETGIQQLGNFQGNLAAAEGKDLQALSEKAPGLVNTAYGTLTAAKQRGDALAEKKGEFKTTTDMKQKAADFLDWYRTQGVHFSQTKIDQKAQEFGVTSSIQKQNAGTSAARASETARHNAVTEAQAAARIKAAALKNTAGGKRGGLTPKQVLDLRGKAETLADQAFNGAPATAKLAALPQLDYTAAIEEAKKEGIPASIYLPAFNAKYPPGTRGRPQTKATAATQKFFASTGRGFGG